MRPEPRYVERTLICMNCGVPIVMGDEGISLWLHIDGYRACAWLRGGLAGAGGETYAAPTDWFEVWEVVGYTSEDWERAWAEWAAGGGD